jgi:hypothetical protein
MVIDLYWEAPSSTMGYAFSFRANPANKAQWNSTLPSRSLPDPGDLGKESERVRERNLLSWALGNM